MQHITVESGVGKTLVEATEQAVVCDERGRVLGIFSPVPDRPDIGELQLDPPLFDFRDGRTTKESNRQAA